MSVTHSTNFGHDSRVVAQDILWAAHRDANPLTPMQLLKLVYIAHGWNLGLHSRPLIYDAVEAWQYGPVIPAIYHQFKRFGGGFITECPPGPQEVVTATERNLLDQVWKGYGKMSGIGLSSLTHQPGTPWDVTIRRLGRGATISNDLIEDHYRRLAQARRTS
jgi:uncharacterized phage-associated protein